MKMIKQAMILAAGFGKRMMPITAEIPKPLVEVNGKTLLQRIIDNLVLYGVNRIVINTHHKAEKINEFIRSYRKPADVEIKVIFEPEILETGGGIINALAEFGSHPFFVTNGDILIPNQPKYNIYHLLNEQWDESRMNCLMLVHDTDKAIGYEGRGDLSLGPKHEIIFSQDSNRKPYIFAGVYVVKPQLFFKYANKNLRVINIFKDHVFDKFYGYKNPYNWLHIGTPEAIKKAEEFLTQHNEKKD